MKKVQFIAILIFVITNIILFLSSYPSIGWWNSGECAIAAYNFSIPVPGGSILHTLLGRAFAVLFSFMPPITAVTLISVLSTSLAAVMLFIIAGRLLRECGAWDRAASLIAASSAALALPFLYSIWQEAGVSRIYTLGLALTSCIVYCGLRVWTGRSAEERLRYFHVLVFLLGIDFAAHRLNTPFLPVAGLLLLFPLRKSALNTRVWLPGILLYALGASLHLILPIRSHLQPLMAFDDTGTFSGLAAWVLMDRHASGSNFFDVLSRKAPLLDYQIQYMYLRYAGWNFLGTAGGGYALPLVLGVAGGLYHAWKHLRSFLFILASLACYSILLVLYLNVRENFHTVREIDRLFLPSFFLFMIWTGAGVYVLARLFNSAGVRLGLGRRPMAVAGAVAALALLPGALIGTNWRACDRSAFTFPADIGRNILESCDENAVLLTSGDNDTYPLWYLQYVEGFRRDVCVANIHLLNLPFYVRQIAEEPCNFPVDSTLLAEYDFMPVAGPDSLYAIAFGAEDADTVTISHPGRMVDAKRMHFANDVVLLNFLRHNRGRRPVYCTEFMPETLMGGLAPHFASEGLVRKFSPHGPGKRGPGRIRENLFTRYAYGAFNNPLVVIDASTRNLYQTYRKLICIEVRRSLESGDDRAARDFFDFMEETLPRWRFSGEQNTFVIETEQLLVARAGGG